MSYFKRSATVILLSLLPVTSQALVPVPSLRFSLGVSPMKFTAGQLTAAGPEPLKNFLTIKPTFLWNFPSMRSRIGAHYLMDIGSPYGFVSIAGIGVTYLLYPLGLSIAREHKDDGVEFEKSRDFSPFIEVDFTPTKFSVSQKLSATQNTYFSAYLYELMVGGGADYPFENGLVCFGGLYYRTAYFNGLETSSGRLGYSGLSLQFGVMTSFE